MPGINLIIDLPVALKKAESLFEIQIKEFSKYFPHWIISIPYKSNHFLCLVVQHSAYHVITEESEQWFIALECQEANSLPFKVGDLLSFSIYDNDVHHLKSYIYSFLNELNSEWFLVLYHKISETLFFANDRLARLPVYYTFTKEGFVLGRDIAFLEAGQPQLSINKLFLTLLSCFGYVPGHGTYYNEIDTLRSRSFGSYSFKTKKYQICNEPAYRLPDIATPVNQDLALTNLVECFLTAVKRQAKDDSNLLGLSGGLDSRTVAAAFNLLQLPYQALTYKDADRTADKDIAIVKELIQALSCQHQFLDLNPESHVDFVQLFKMKHGLNFMGVAFLQQFFRILRQKYPYNNTFFTGDGGDKVLPDLRPEKHIHDVNSLVTYIFQKQTVFSTNVVSSWFGLKQSDLIDYMIVLLKNYPSPQIDAIYRFFILEERGGRWLFEGEDRNRAYFRTMTPFYDFEFYQLALSIPWEWKKNYHLYKLFLQKLSPTLIKIKNANFRFHPWSIHHKFWFSIRSYFPSFILKTLRNSSSMLQTVHPSTLDYLISVIFRLAKTDETCSLMPSLSINLDKCISTFNRTQLYHLFTILLILNKGREQKI